MAVKRGWLMPEGQPKTLKHANERFEMSYTPQIQFQYLQGEKKLSVKFSYQPNPDGSVYWTKERLLTRGVVEAMLDAFPDVDLGKWIRYNVEERSA